MVRATIRRVGDQHEAQDMRVVLRTAWTGARPNRLLVAACAARFGLVAQRSEVTGNPERLNPFDGYPLCCDTFMVG